MFYEISIPLANLDITASDIETNGIGILKVSTVGTSGVDCLPYDLSMSDNAALPYSMDSSTSYEKEDEDHITVPLARIGKAFTPGAVTPTEPQPPTEYMPPTEPLPSTEPHTEAPTEPPVQIIYGDADDDGDVTIFDVTYIQRYDLGIRVTSPINLLNADVDGDESVSILDATYVQRYLLNIIRKFPAKA